jgi:hypothetical protein
MVLFDYAVAIFVFYIFYFLIIFLIIIIIKREKFQITPDQSDKSFRTDWLMSFDQPTGDNALNSAFKSLENSPYRNFGHSQRINRVTVVSIVVNTGSATRFPLFSN